MSRNSERRDAGEEHRSVTSADALQRAPSALCETILSVLDRDQGLRRNYLRRRWQGLIERGPEGSNEALKGGACPASLG